MKYFLLIVLIMVVFFMRHYMVHSVFTPQKRVNKKSPSLPYENIEMEGAKGTIRGWLKKSEKADGCFILVHGWGSNRSVMLRYADSLIEKGYDVLLIDVLGHGESDSVQKQVSIETFVMSIQAAIDFVEARSEVNSHAIYVLGHSMGGLAASIVNATDPRLNGLITDSMPTSLESISKSMAGKVTLPYRPFGWLIVSWFLVRGGVFFKARGEWHLEKIFNQQLAPAFSIHSDLDQKVPISSVDVLMNNSNFKEVIKVKTKGHHNCVQDEHFWQHVFHFIESTKGGEGL
ncbi:alpha/beta hydrolase [Lysinibacillus sp. NPDC097287]|uniref:alpha/beta hydrolase n=1 Tax=Lysinibacillus sp. NPDC097287 TaxID=3364144 RepID=UPI0037F7ECA6